MKKTKFFFLTLLAGLLMSVNAWAADPITSAVVPDGYYYIRSTVDAYDLTTPYIIANGGAMNLSAANTDTKTIWKITSSNATSGTPVPASGKKYSIENYATGMKWVSGPSAPLGSGVSSYNIDYTESGSYYMFRGRSDGNIGNAGAINATSATSFGRSDGGSYNKWVLIPADDVVELYQKAQAAIASGEETYNNTLTPVIKDPDGEEVTTSTKQFSSNNPCSAEGSFDNLLDGNAQSFWHSSWQSSTGAYHELYVNGLDANDTKYWLTFLRRKVSATEVAGNDHVLTMEVYGGTVETPSNPNSTPATFNTTSGDDPLCVISLPKDKFPESGEIGFDLGDTGYTALRFRVTMTYNSWNATNRAYFHFGDFHLWNAKLGQALYPDADPVDVAALQLALANLKAAVADGTVTQKLIDDVNDAVSAIKSGAQINYTVSITGAPTTAYITVGGTQYGDGATFKHAPLDAADVEASVISKYKSSVTINGSEIKVVYTLDMSQFSHITDISNLSNSKAYYILPYDNSRGAWTYNSADAGWVNSTVKAGTQASILNTDQHFALLKSERGNYYLYSIAAGKFVSYATDESITTAGHDKHRAALTDTPQHKINFNASTSSYTSYPFVISLMTPDRKDLGVSNSYAHGVITFWNSTADGGNCVRIYDTEVAFDPTSALEKIAEIEANYLTDVQALAPYFDNAGAVYALTTAAKASLNSTYETLIGQEVVTKAEYTAFKADFDKAEKVALTTGYYQLKVITYDRIATSSVKGGSDATTCQSDVAGDAGSIAYINTEDGSIRLQNKYIATTGNTAGSTLSDTPCAFQFVDLGGKAAIGLTSGGQYDWLHSGAGRDYGVCSWSQSASASHWAIIPVSELAATTSFIEGEGYVGTAFMPFAYTFNALSEAKAYRVETIAGNDGYYRAQPITGTIPANCPVIIKASLNPTLNIVASAEALTEENVLEGTYMGTTGAGQYGLAYQNSSLVFAPIASGTAIRRNSAYIPASLEVKGVYFDNETGIESIHNSEFIIHNDGKFLENGKIVIVKNNAKYNVAGQIIK